MLLEHGADPNVRDGEQGTPPMRVAGSGETDRVSTLLAAGADVHLADRARVCSLPRMCRGERPERQALPTAGANPNLQDTEGLVPREVAERAGKATILAALDPRGEGVDGRGGARRSTPCARRPLN